MQFSYYQIVVFFLKAEPNVMATAFAISREGRGNNLWLFVDGSWDFTHPGLHATSMNLAVQLFISKPSQGIWNVDAGRRLISCLNIHIDYIRVYVKRSKALSEHTL